MITFLDYYKKLPQNLVAEYIGSREIQFFCLGGIEEIDKIEEIDLSPWSLVLRPSYYTYSNASCSASMRSLMFSVPTLSLTVDG